MANITNIGNFTDAKIIYVVVELTTIITIITKFIIAEQFVKSLYFILIELCVADKRLFDLIVAN